jgi:glycosyltransferase involved in cell wall biosynthesis
MRVAMMSGLAGPGALAGGVWTAAATQAAALTEAGHEVRVLSGWLGPVPMTGGEGFVLDLLRVRRPAPRSGLRALWSPHVREATRNLARWADVAHVHLCRDSFTMLGAPIFAAAGVPVAAQTHGMLTPPRSAPSHAYDRAVTSRVLPRIDRFLSLHPGETNQLTGFGIDPTAIVGIDNATVPPPYAWLDRPGRTFCFVSRLHARKQPMVFVDAALALLAGGTEATFVLAGPDQGQRAAVEARIRASGRQASFTILDALDRDGAMKVLSESTAMVLPSQDEPYPMIVLEALAMGVPAVVTNQTGLADLLLAAHAALVVEPTVAAVTAALRQLAADGELRRRLSAAGRAAYDRHWRPQALADRLSAVYRDLVHADLVHADLVHADLVHHDRAGEVLPVAAP